MSDCTCLEYGHGMLLTRVNDPLCPVHQKMCGFCKGRPVGDAASWLDGKPRPPAACPRCGKVTPRSAT